MVLVLVVLEAIPEVPSSVHPQDDPALMSPGFAVDVAPLLQAPSPDVQRPQEVFRKAPVQQEVADTRARLFAETAGSSATRALKVGVEDFRS